MFKKIAYSSVAISSGLGLILNGGAVVFADDEDYSFLFDEKYNPELDEEPDRAFIFGGDLIKFCPDRLCELADEELYRRASIQKSRKKYRELKAKYDSTKKEDLAKLQEYRNAIDDCKKSIRHDYEMCEVYRVNLARFLAENVSELTNGNDDNTFVLHVGVILSIFDDMIELEKKWSDLIGQIRILDEKIKKLKDQNISDNDEQLVSLFKEKEAIKKPYEQVKKEYKETRKKLDESVKAFLQYIREKLVEAKENKNLIKRCGFSTTSILNGNNRYFISNLQKVNELVNIFKEAATSSFCGFGKIRDYLNNFRFVLENSIKEIGLIRFLYFDRNENKEALLRFIYFFNAGNFGDAVKKMKGKIYRAVLRAEEEALKSAKYLAGVKKDEWIKYFKNEEGFPLVERIAEAYRNLVALEKEYSFVEAKKARCEEVENFFSKVENARRGLVSMVAAFYFVNCSQKAKSVDPDKAWNDFLEGKKEYPAVIFKLWSNKFSYDPVMIQKLIDTCKMSGDPDNFFNDPARMERLAQICKVGSDGESPFVKVGGVFSSLHYFAVELGYWISVICKRRKNVNHINEIKKKIDAESIDLVKDSFLEVVEEKGYCRGSIKDILQEIFSTCKDLAKIKTKWKKSFGDDVTTGFVESIVKYYLHFKDLKQTLDSLNKLHDRKHLCLDGVDLDVKKSFFINMEKTRESLRPEVEKTEGYLCTLVTNFYVLVCAKNRGLNPYTLWDYILGTDSSISKRYERNYEFTDVE